MKPYITVTIGIAIFSGVVGSTEPVLAVPPLGGCGFEPAKMSFVGTPEQQAACLLKKVKQQGSGAVEQPIPPWLLERIGRPATLEVKQIQQYLDRNHISSADLGGALRFGDTADRRYFVIHDTSSPVLPNAPTFPAEIDSPNHLTNKLTGWAEVSKKVNLIISRDGRSRTFQDWAVTRPMSATKVEMQFNAARRLFVHVENIQVRMRPPGSWAWRSPDPGFGVGQERRLALAYIVASVRAGHWLIPAYHFNIDQGIPGAHDDPQNANLAQWVMGVETIEKEIRAISL